MISVEVDDKDAKFAADLANAHEPEVTKLLGRLAVSEAQLRRVFFEKQLQETKENLVKAEQSLQAVQEKSGVIVLDKQAEALISGAALVRAQISEREVQLHVLRTSATDQNPAVMRLNSELRGMRAELARMESSQGGAPGSAVDLPVGRLPEAAVDYVRARRELKLQETLLEGMVRQYEIAKLDEAKEGPALQCAGRRRHVPPDRKSKPVRSPDRARRARSLALVLGVALGHRSSRYLARRCALAMARRARSPARGCDTRLGLAPIAATAAAAPARAAAARTTSPGVSSEATAGLPMQRQRACVDLRLAQADADRVGQRADRERRQRHAADIERIRRMDVAPLDQERQRAGGGSAAIGADREAPAQQAARRHAVGGDDAAGIAAGIAPRLCHRPVDGTAARPSGRGAARPRSLPAASASSRSNQRAGAGAGASGSIAISSR